MLSSVAAGREEDARATLPFVVLLFKLMLPALLFKLLVPLLALLLLVLLLLAGMFDCRPERIKNETNDGAKKDLSKRTNRASRARRDSPTARRGGSGDTAVPPAGRGGGRLGTVP